MTGLQSARFDKLIVYDFVSSGYIDVALALEGLREQAQNLPIAADEDRILTIEAN